MDTDDLIEAVAEQGAAFGAAVREAALTDRVPTCPDWDVSKLVVHLGTVHRWATDIVAHARTERPAFRDFLPARGVDLLGWYDEGLPALIDALRAAPDGRPGFTLYPWPGQREFWARRQALETAVHRADAEAALGRVPHLDPELADSGVVELLLDFRLGPRAFERAGTLALRSTDGAARWSVALSPDGFAAVPSDGDGADATVTGTSSELLLWLSNRHPRVRIDGDEKLAASWAATVTI